MKKRYVWLKDRPADIPADWVIHNAPRPLWGHKEWQGDFLSGVFYVAIDPRGERATEMIDYNTRMDAKELVFVEEDQVVADSLEWYRENYPKAIKDIDPDDSEYRQMLVSGWLRRAYKAQEQEA